MMDIGAKILKLNLPEGQLSDEQLNKLLDWHSSELVRYNKLNNYYLGNHEILNRKPPKSTLKANNKLVNNFCEYITTILTGFFMGEPVNYTVKLLEGQTINSDYTKFKDTLEYNDEQDENNRLASESSIFGHTFEILWNDEQADVRFISSSPLTTFGIYDPETVEDKLVAVIRYFTKTDILTKEQIETIEIYKKDVVDIYKREKKATKKDGYDSKSHLFLDVPAVEFLNNSMRIGDFEGILSLNDAYNNLTSDIGNNIENTVRAYMILTGMTGTTADEFEKIKQDGAFLIPKDADIKYLTIQLDSENNKFTESTIRNNIHKFSKTPDLLDEKFSNASSGIAMEFKLFSTEQVTGNKELKFKKGLQRRIELIYNNMNSRYLNSKEYLNVIITFSRNIPVNLNDIITSFMKLRGVISDKTLISKLPLDINVDDEIKKIKEQNTIE